MHVLRMCFCSPKFFDTHCISATCTKRSMCAICKNNHPTSLHGFLPGKRIKPAPSSSSFHEKKSEIPVYCGLNKQNSVGISMCVVSGGSRT